MKNPIFVFILFGLWGIYFSAFSQDSNSFGRNEAWTSNPYFGSRGSYFADVTGDGKADAIVVNDDRITVRRSDGGQFLSNEAWTTNPYFGSRGTTFADVTGDGKADAIVVNDDRVTVRRSDGAKFLPNEAWTSNPYFGSRGIYFADVTGDGKADAIVVNEDRITVRRSDGVKFLSNEAWTSNPYYGSRGTAFADVTGDGKADAIVVNDDKVTVRRSNGAQFQSDEAWTSNPYYGLRGTAFADVTGDGKADAIVVNDDKIIVRRSEYLKFLNNEAWTSNPFYGSQGTYFADVTGDKRVDVIVVNNDKVVVRRSEKASLPQPMVFNRSIFMTHNDEATLDKDVDGVVDYMEDELANAFRPYLIFDDAESARAPHEPITLFQVGKADQSQKKLVIKWVFLFRWDGGYGPSANWPCSDDHEGDNDSAKYELISEDGGNTWELNNVGIGDEGLEWPTNSLIQVADGRHPVIYMSASKHHEYFNTDNDEDDSIYSGSGCNDDVNGRGDEVLVDLQSISRKKQGTYFNNVGEVATHPTPPFVNDLSVYFQGHSAWEYNDFYDSGASIGGKWWNRFGEDDLFKIEWAVSTKSKNFPAYGWRYLSEGAAVYGDWPSLVFGNVPENLNGARLLKTSIKDNTSSGDFFIEITLKKPAIVYVAHDDRIKNKPDWLTVNFIRTPEKITVHQNNVNGTIEFHSTLYMKSVLSGKIVIGGNVVSGETQNNAMYSVFVLPL